MEYKSTTLNLHQSAGFSIVTAFVTLSKYVTTQQSLTLWTSASFIGKHNSSRGSSVNCEQKSTYVLK
jgi:hypothetical protein